MKARLPNSSALPIILLPAILAMSTLASCVTKEKCIYFQKVGHRWEATILGEARDQENAPVSITATAERCMTDEENATLQANDPDDPVNVALRNQLLAEAQEACGVEAIAKDYTDVKCNPFDDPITSDVLPIEGPCNTNELEGVPQKKGVDCPDINTSATDTGGEETDTGDPTTGSPTTGVTPGLAAELAALDDLITCEDDTCHVSQALIDAVLSDPAALLDDPTRLRPKTEKGEVVGMQFTGVASGTLGDRLGFQNGDIIVAVDGLPFRDEAEWLAVSIEIFDAETVTVTTRRDGKITDRVFIRD